MYYVHRTTRGFRVLRTESPQLSLSDQNWNKHVANALIFYEFDSLKVLMQTLTLALVFYIL